MPQVRVSGRGMKSASSCSRLRVTSSFLCCARTGMIRNVPCGESSLLVLSAHRCSNCCGHRALSTEVTHATLVDDLAKQRGQSEAHAAFVRRGASLIAALHLTPRAPTLQHARSLPTTARFHRLLTLLQHILFKRIASTGLRSSFTRAGARDERPNGHSRAPGDAESTEEPLWRRRCAGGSEDQVGRYDARGRRVWHDDWT